jgi:protein phosphatase
VSTGPVRVSVFGKTDLGRARDHNEDTFLVADLTHKRASLHPEVRRHVVGPRGSLFMVADGMGGAAAGEVASAMASDLIYQHMITVWADDPEVTAPRFAFRLREAVEQANERIHDYTMEHAEVKGMGTTVTAAGVFESDLYLTQIGEEEAVVSERRNIILQALGPDPRVKVDLTYQPLRRGDVLVICSDGLSGQVKRDEIARIVAESPDLQQVCSRLIDLANQRGGPDNITAIAARFEGEGLPEPGGDEAVGYQVYPLDDGEHTTQQIPVYRGSPVPVAEARDGPAVRVVVLLALAALAAAYLIWGP